MEWLEIASADFRGRLGEPGNRKKATDNGCSLEAAHEVRS
jgi:hypothetical protein